MPTNKQTIHPELRWRGKWLRLMRFYFSPFMIPIDNWFMKTFVKGRWFGKSTTYHEHYITRPDGTKLRLCICIPKETKNQVPGLLWLHGGGYAIGLPEQDFATIDAFAKRSGCIVVAPNYRRSVEAPYPAALEDSYLALLWMRAHAHEYGIRPDQLFIGGDSAGGGLTAALSLYARDQGEVAIAFQMPLYPMLDDRMKTPSSQNNTAPVWDSKANKLGWQLYLGPLYGTNEVPIYAAPSRATDYSHLPPTCSFVGTIEPFYNETVAYIEALKQANIKVHFQVYEGCFHAFDRMGSHTTIGKEASQFLMQSFDYAVKHYFAKQPNH